MRYRLRKIVEAFQLTSARISSNEEWPEWLQAAWHNGDEPGSLVVWDTTPRRLALLGRAPSRIIIKPGDWIVQEADERLYEGRLHIVSSARFATDYEPVQ